MKSVIVAMALVLSAGAMAQDKGTPVSGKTTPNPVVAPEANDKCVKKDKQGKCPPLPNSPKPTPKKKTESK